MPLVQGDLLGHYKIQSLIGRGGMGEVYRALDTKLEREVAVKVLPAAFAVDPERLARFEREAKLLAALNHPNIAQIYGVEEGALVMELVEGESPKGPLPFDDAWKIMAQVAEGLEYAHERRVVHRDLKPSNLKVTPDGRVKILDFGLAKALSGEPRVAASAGSDSPTLTMGATQAGVILGTAAYMAPEQIKGKAADRRADIWAFGVVLYELLTGERPFKGKDSTEIMAHAVMGAPALDRAPARVKRLLTACLQKEPEDRLASIADARILLEEETPRMSDAAPQPARPRMERIAWAGLLVLVACGLGFGWWRAARVTEANPVMRFSIAAELGAAGRLPTMAISHDGSMVAYRSGPANPILIRRLDQFEAQSIPGTGGGQAAPCISPDNQWIAFSADGDKTLKKLHLSGGGALTVAEGLNRIISCDWAEDGSIYIGDTPGISRVPASGGKVEAVAEPDPKKKNEFRFLFPQLLPGGKLLLFNSSLTGAAGDLNVVVLNLKTGERKIVLEKLGFARYAPTGAGSGHLVYWRKDTLFGVPLDLTHLTSGPPAPVADGVGGLITRGFFDFSDSGTLVYEPPGNNPLLDGALVPAWVDRQGGEQAVAGVPPRVYVSYYAGGIQISPDGKQVALASLDNDSSATIWVYDFVRTTFRKQTFDGFSEVTVWSPDGKRLIDWAAAGVADNKGEMKSTSADGSGQPETLVTNELGLFPGSISPDGKTLLGDELKVTSQPGNAFALSLESGDRKPKLLFDTQFNRHGAIFSPDGKWIAYTSNESGSDQVYVVPYPVSGGKWQISTAGGAFPRWNRNGRELFYREGTKFMAVDVETGAAFRPGTPKMLFDKPYTGAYDVAPDGKRFLMFKSAAPAAGQSSELRVIVNWFEELRQRAPGR